jgi:hypothetical protein
MVFILNNINITFVISHGIAGADATVMHTPLPEGAMACRSSEWRIKNTGRTGHLHSTCEEELRPAQRCDRG